LTAAIRIVRISSTGRSCRASGGRSCGSPS
jgi:hypothetical protein